MLDFLSTRIEGNWQWTSDLPSHWNRTPNPV